MTFALNLDKVRRMALERLQPDACVTNPLVHALNGHPSGVEVVASPAIRLTNVVAISQLATLAGDGAVKLERYRHACLRSRMSNEKTEELAASFIRRDEAQDDRRSCVECVELTLRGRCSAASRGLFSWSSTQLEPVLGILQRCEGFKPTALLSQALSRPNEEKK